MWAVRAIVPRMRRDQWLIGLSMMVLAAVVVGLLFALVVATIDFAFADHRDFGVTAAVVAPLGGMLAYIAFLAFVFFPRRTKKH